MWKWCVWVTPIVYSTWGLHGPKILGFPQSLLGDYPPTPYVLMYSYNKLILCHLYVDVILCTNVYYNLLSIPYNSLMSIDTHYEWYCEQKLYANGWNVWTWTISSPILFACSSFPSTTYYLGHWLHSRYDSSSRSSLQRLQSTLLRHEHAKVCRGGSPCQPRSQDHLQLRSTGNHHHPHPERQPNTCSKLTQICPKTR